ncbi:MULTISPECIES: hypothetical protein [Pseudomonadati]|uniref:Uncharacterized protein n=1 Tax=Shewanella aestuarii TaxID=1028752 RepID=A0ABT0L1N0_9GAMM|nr:hypothetical protein [Shewanella aestuarii]MCL1117322.1 hypothetical protein [Shewanella aestuarii]
MVKANKSEQELTDFWTVFGRKVTSSANDPARRRKHLRVGLTKTSLFWILAGSSVPEFLLLRLSFIGGCNNTRANSELDKIGSECVFLSKNKQTQLNIQRRQIDYNWLQVQMIQRDAASTSVWA